MKQVVALLLLAFATCEGLLFDSKLDEHWNNFKTVFNKSYPDREESARRLIWEQRVLDIIRHNLKADIGLHSYWKGINKYSDLSPHEFSQRMNGFKLPGKFNRNSSTYIPPANIVLPDSVDWRKQGLVTAVKDQGNCGSCWAFSTTGSLEGQHKKKTGNLIALSEQNLVDCAKSNQGCNGGWMDLAFEYVEKNKGIDTEESYPYKAKEQPCQFNQSNVGAIVTGYVDIPSGDEAALKEAVATIGPISVAIDAGGGEFQVYRSGIYDSAYCSNGIEALSHAVLVVGYGTENGKDYWLVKNSWGESWGLKGYIKMSRNKNNQCGIATKASYPLV